MNGKNADLNTADNDIQPSQLAADHGNTGTATSESGKVSVLNRRTLGVASVLGLLFASLLAGTLFFTSADDSASPAPKVDANTVSDNTVSTHAQIKPAEFSTANSFYHSVLDPVNVSASPKAGRALAASRNQGAAETSAAQSTSANSARSQCSGAACLSPRRAPVATGVKLKLFKLGVADSATVTRCTRSRLCTAADGEIVGGARFALYEGRTVDETKLIDTYTVGEGGVELSGLQQGSYTLKEVAAPAGYILNPNSYTLMVGADGRVGYRTGKIIRYPNGEFYIPNLKAPEPEVWLFKLGVKDLKDCTWGSCSADVAGSEILGGATFALYEGTAADEAHKVGETFTVGQDGLKIPGLQAGKTYTLKEVAAPENYDINPATYTFEVDADGKAKYQSDAGSEFFVDNKIYFPNQKKAAPPAVTVRLFKLGVADSATVTRCTRSRLCTAADGEIVGGARFALYEGRTVDETKLIDTYTVGEGGVELSGLQQGSYTLKEVEAPAGYELNPNTVTFTVRANGTVYRRYSKFFYDFKNNEFYFPNLKVQTIDISLNKVSDKDTPLENVKFDLYEADNPDKPVQNITTGNDGKANLTVTPGGKYRLVETQTTPGYALLPQPIEFQVEANGTVTIDKQNGNVNTVTGGDKTLKVVNYPEGKLPLSGQSGFLVVLLSGLSLLLVGVAISLVGRKRN